MLKQIIKQAGNGPFATAGANELSHTLSNVAHAANGNANPFSASAANMMGQGMHDAETQKQHALQSMLDFTKTNPYAPPAQDYTNAAAKYIKPVIQGATNSANAFGNTLINQLNDSAKTKALSGQVTSGVINDATQGINAAGKAAQPFLVAAHPAAVNLETTAQQKLQQIQAAMAARAQAAAASKRQVEQAAANAGNALKSNVSGAWNTLFGK